MKRTCFASDTIALTSRHLTDEGYLVAPGNLARTGVQDYRAFELGLDADGMDPMKVIRLHRPPEEVFDAASMASFEGKPITIEHPKVAVTADNWSELAKGDVRGVSRSGDLMTSTLVIRSKDAVQAVQDGKVELSNGYSFNLDMTPGQTADGRAYDGVQRNIRGNHVALVDAARCGSACRIADSQPQGVKKMPKVVVDGIPLEADETTAAAIKKLVDERDALKAGADSKTEVAVADVKVTVVGDGKVLADAVKKMADAHAAEVAALRKDVVTPEVRDAMVAEWSKLIVDAKRLMPDIVTDGKTCLAIRREVIGALVGKDATAKAVADAVFAGKDVQTADAEVVRSAFNALAASIKTHAADADVQANDAAVADALTGVGKATESKTELTGRDKFMSRQSQAWQKQQ